MFHSLKPCLEIDSVYEITWKNSDFISLISLPRKLLSFSRIARIMEEIFQICIAL